MSRKCPVCKRTFPNDCIQPQAISDGIDLRYESKCAICANHVTNAAAGLPRGTPFGGPLAEQLRQRCLEHVAKTGQQLEGDTR